MIMVDQKLIDWIKKGEEKGYSDKQLVDYLAKKGFKKQDIDEAFNSIKNKAISSQGFTFWDKMQYLISNPKLFFDKAKSEKGIKEALLTFVIVAFGVSILQYGMTFFMRFLLPQSYGYFGYLGLFGPFFIIGGFLISIAMSLLYAGIVHSLVMVFKGQGSYAETYKAYAYGMIPAMILLLIPFIGFFGGIYSLALIVIGLSRLHNLTIGKAVIAVLAPILLLLGLLVIFFIYLIRNFRFF